MTDRLRHLSSLLGFVLLASLLLVAGRTDAATSATSWPTVDGPQETGHQDNATGPLNPGVRWVVQSTDVDGWTPDFDTRMLHDGQGRVLFTADDPSGQPGIVALDSATGTYRWGSTELDLETGCGPVVAADSTIWGIGHVPAAHSGSTGQSTAHALTGLDPADGTVQRSWQPAGDLRCITMHLTAEGLLVAWVTETREYEDPHWGTLVNSFNGLVGVDPTTGTEVWRLEDDATPDGCKLGEPLGVAPAAGPANTMYLEVGFCSTGAENRLVALDTSDGTFRASYDRGTGDTRKYFRTIGAGMVVGFEDNTTGMWVVGVADGGSTMTQAYRIQLRGPEDTSGGEPQAGECLYDVCSFGTVALSDVDANLGFYNGAILDRGAQTGGWAMVDLDDGSVVWTQPASAFPGPAGPMSTDASGRLWYATALETFGDSSTGLASISSQGVASSDVDGDGKVEYGMSPEQANQIAVGSVTMHGIGALDDDGFLYGTANNYISGAQGYWFFSLEHDAGSSTDGGTTDGTTGDSTTDRTVDEAALVPEIPEGQCPTPFVLAGSGTVARVSGTDRFETAIAISQARFADAGGLFHESCLADHAILARSNLFADSLAGSPLTAAGPLLLTRTNQLEERSLAEIRRVLGDTGTVYLLGGGAAVAPEVEQAVAAAGYTTRRLAGRDRIGTAIAIAEEVVRLEGGAVDSVLLARSNGTATSPTAAWADSVTGGAFAAASRTPILVTRSAALDDRVGQFLARHGVQQTYLLGGTAALAPAVEAAVTSPTRIAGAGRAETAVAIARDLWRVAPPAERQYILMNGFAANGWVDGLAAAGLAADQRAPLLLSRVDHLPGATAAEVATSDPCLVRAAIVGGVASLASSVVAHLWDETGDACVPEEPAEMHIANLCGGEGHPCTWGEADPEVQRRSEDLAREAAGYLSSGRTVEEVSAWLGSQPGVASLTSAPDDLRVSFRLVGGLTTHAMSPDSQVFLREGGQMVTPPEGTTARSSSRTSKVVAGEGDAKKFALVLSPFESELARQGGGSRDLAMRIDEILGYADNVVFADGLYAMETVMGQFMKRKGSWDVVHVNTHGTGVCYPPDANRSGWWCDIQINMGKATLAQYRELNALYPSHGLEWSQVCPKDEPCTEENIVLIATLGVDGLRTLLGGAWSNSVLMLDGCRAAWMIPLIEGTLRSQRVGIIAWTGDTEQSTSALRMRELYEILDDTGRTLQEAYQELKDQGKTAGYRNYVADGTGAVAQYALDRSNTYLTKGSTRILKAWNSDGETLSDRLKIAWPDESDPPGTEFAQMVVAGAEIRIREIVHVRDEDPVRRLASEAVDELEIYGPPTNPILPLRVGVDGIGLYGPDEFEVQVTIQGRDKTFDPIVLDYTLGEEHTTEINEHEWEIRENIPLPLSLDENNDIEIRAEIRILPESGKSEHETYPHLFTYEIDLRSQVTETGTDYRFEGLVDVTLHPRKVGPGRYDGVDEVAYVPETVFLQLGNETCYSPAGDPQDLHPIEHTGGRFNGTTPGSVELAYIIPEGQPSVDLDCDGNGTADLSYADPWYRCFVLTNQDEFDPDRGEWVADDGWVFGGTDPRWSRVTSKTTENGDDSCTVDTEWQVRRIDTSST